MLRNRMDELTNFLEIADIPNTRKDLTKPENVKWLVQNLGIRNSELIGFFDANQQLKQLYKQTRF